MEPLLSTTTLPPDPPNSRAKTYDKTMGQMKPLTLDKTNVKSEEKMHHLRQQLDDAKMLANMSPVFADKMNGNNVHFL